MPVQPTQSLIAVAKDSSIRVHERIKIIKGEDKRISSPEEAQAVLAIPYDEVTWLEDKNELPFAQLDANNYLKYGGRCLRDDLADLYRYCKKRGSEYIAEIFGFAKTGPTVAQSKK